MTHEHGHGEAQGQGLDTAHPASHDHGHGGGLGHVHGPAGPASRTGAHSHGGHGHGHGGHGGHGHVHAPASFGRAFAIGIGLNTAFVVIEAGYGLASNSMALLADAGHNLSDVLGLVAAWAAATLARRPPSARYTYGLRASTILAALFNAVFLLLAVGAIAWEALLRLIDPQPVAEVTVMAVAAVGILVNGGTALLFASGRERDLNIRGAFLHMAADAAVSLGVVVAGLVILWTGALWLDPAVSLAIVAVIVWSTWGLLRDSLALSLNAVPPGIEPGTVLACLERQQGVASVHDLHIWPASTTDVVMTAHLVMPGGHPGDAFILGLCDELRHAFGIHHVTLQVETDPSTPCPLKPAEVL
jgi:cobalt-zinc-cadmium efflux system protein